MSCSVATTLSIVASPQAVLAAFLDPGRLRAWSNARPWTLVWGGVYTQAWPVAAEALKVFLARD